MQPTSRCLCLLTCGVLAATTGCAQIEGMAGSTRNLFDVFSGDTALKAAQAMENERFADQRRKGINKLVSREYGRRDPYTKRYAQIARNDSDWLVRATAIRALNRSRYKPAAPVFVEALKKDEHALVRSEAAKALANVPDADAVAALVAAVQNPNEDRDVRIAAADALRHYRQLDVARALAGQLGGNDFGVAWQARRSLQSLTGRDLRYDQAAWSAYLNGPDKPFS